MSPPPLPGAGAPGPATAVRPTCHRSCLPSRAPAPGRASATHLAGARPTPSGGGGGGGGGVARRALPPHSPRSRGGSGGGRGTARRCGVGAPSMSRASPPGRPQTRPRRGAPGHATATPRPRHGHATATGTTDDPRRGTAARPSTTGPRRDAAARPSKRSPAQPDPLARAQPSPEVRGARRAPSPAGNPPPTGASGAHLHSQEHKGGGSATSLHCQVFLITFGHFGWRKSLEPPHTVQTQQAPRNPPGIFW